MKNLALAAAVLACGPGAFAAGVDSRTYTCAQLHGLIAANRFVFINNPSFDDFVVADHSSFSQIIQRRSVPTSDTPQCCVNHCRPSNETPL